MTTMTQAFAASFCLLGAGAFTAQADGVDPLFFADGSYIDEMEIIGDVVLPSGEKLVALEMREQHMKFFVDPDAIYVTMYPENPIIVNKTAFYGYWISTQSVDVGDWPTCPNDVTDENGVAYQAHGTLIWTNTGLSDELDLAFQVDLGTCFDRQTPWAYSLAAIEMGGLGGVAHGDIPNQDTYQITEASGDRYIVEMADFGTTLISVTPRTIEVPVATENSSSETFFEQEVFVMYADCTTSSTRRGFGTWAWANGGFVVGFDTVGFSFPRMDAPVENDGACRL